MGLRGGASAGLILASCYVVGCAGASGLRSTSPAASAKNSVTKPPTPALAITQPPSDAQVQLPTEPATLRLAARQEPDSPPANAPSARETVAGAEKPSESGDKALRDLYDKAAKKIASMDSYMLRLRRREMVRNQKMPEELMLFKCRQEPMSLYFKWLGNEGKGREVIFVKGQYDNKIQVRLAAGDIPFMPAGMRMSFAVDSQLVMDKSRYPITEAGLGSLVARFGRLVTALEKGDESQGSAKYLGRLKRPEFDDKLDCVRHILAPKCDPLFPRGGERLWFFDPAWDLPVLVISQDEAGREVEYYCHDRIVFPVRLDKDDFNPDLFGKATK